MNNGLTNIEYRDDVLTTMREMVEQGTDVRRLTDFLQRQLELNSESVIPVMAYFRRAFSLPLKDVLPIREWLGTDDDSEINKEIMPKILKARSKWPQASV